MKKEQLRGLAASQRATVRRNAERLLETGNDSQKAAAVRTIADLDEIEAEERQAQSEETARRNPAERVSVAFRMIPMTETERGLVEVLLDNPGSTSTELSAAMGWKGQIWHMKFGEMCKEREAYLWPAEPSEVRGVDFWCGILATYGEESEFWTMKPEVAAAFKEMGLSAQGKKA